MHNLNLWISVIEMDFLLTLFWLSVIVPRSATAKKDKELTFALMITQSGSIGDWSHFIPAIDLALEKINQDDAILPEYSIRYHDEFEDTDTQVR